MKCQVCSYVSEEGSRFCHECGSNLVIQAVKPAEPIKPLKPSTSPTSTLVDASLLTTYQNLLVQIEDLSYVDEELANQRLHHISTQKEVEAQNQRVNNLEAYMLREFADVERLQNLTMSSLVSRLKGDREARLEKEEAEYLAAKEKLEMAEQTLMDLVKQEEEAKKQLDIIIELDNHRQTLNAELNKLIFTIGEQMKHPEEDALEEKVNQLRAKLGPIREEHGQITNAHQYLQSALQNFSRALDSLNSAQNYADYDSFLGGGFFVDSAKHSNYDRAKDEIRRGQYNLQHAYNLNPNLPRLREVHLETGGEFFDIWFDNIFSDFQMRNRIKEARYRVSDAISDIRHVIGETSQHLHKLDVERSQITSELNTTNDSLKKMRIEIIQSLIS